jgi:acetyltransferase-like isoleucine patch superfamily enzyme
MSDSVRLLVDEARRTPWKAVNELKRLAWLPAVRSYFWWQGIPWGAGWRIYGLPVIQRSRASTIRIGAAFEMRNWFASNPLGVSHPCLLVTWSSDAAIRLGDRVGMTGCTVCAQTRIDIGSGVLLGANSVVADTDFHALDPARRAQPGAAAPIVIEDDVFVGMHALILKGTRIGRGSVIGAGSVVTRDIPPGVVAAGNPARVVRTLNPV